MVPIKILGVSGSPVKRVSNTAKMVRRALEGAASLGNVEIDFIDLAELHIEHCTGCRSCRKKKVAQCLMLKDDMNSLYPRIIAADAIILGSPVYFAGVTSKLKAFMDRTTCLGGDAGFKLKYKVGSGITVGGTRHGGQEYTLSQIHHYFLLTGGVVVTGVPTHGYWGAAGVGGPIDEDTWPIAGEMIKALDVCVGLGKRVVNVARLIKAGAVAEGDDLLQFPTTTIP